jgi:hypothetical protein
VRPEQRRDAGSEHSVPEVRAPEVRSPEVRTPEARSREARRDAGARGYSPITLQIRPIMMKKPVNIPIRAMPP